MVLIGIAAISGLMLLASHADEAGRGKSQVANMVLLVAVTACAGLLARTVPPMPST